MKKFIFLFLSIFILCGCEKIKQINPFKTELEKVKEDYPDAVHYGFTIYKYDGYKGDNYYCQRAEDFVNHPMECPIKFLLGDSKFDAIIYLAEDGNVKWKMWKKGEAPNGKPVYPLCEKEKESYILPFIVPDSHLD